MKLFNAFGKTENRAHTLNTKNWIKLKKKKKKRIPFTKPTIHFSKDTSKIIYPIFHCKHIIRHIISKLSTQ